MIVIINPIKTTCLQNKFDLYICLLQKTWGLSKVKVKKTLTNIVKAVSMDRMIFAQTSNLRTSCLILHYFLPTQSTGHNQEDAYQKEGSN